MVQGHTDSVGGVNNQALSKARAKATLDYLGKKLPGVDISVAGFGPKKPAADNKSDEGRATNRRAVVLIG
jgi:outer membrane protein OmpA-like peptidoglycan-associated protein